MKRFFCALLSLALLMVSGSLAENGEGLFDITALDEDESLDCYIDDNRVDTVYRPVDQPFEGTASEGSVVAYLDYVELANPGVVVLRLTIGLEVYEELYGTELVLKAGDTEITLAADPIIAEYDMICQEDYTVYLLGETAALMDALMNGDGELSFTIRGEREITGSLPIPAETVRAIWEKYVSLGGPEQDFSRLR